MKKDWIENLKEEDIKEFSLFGFGDYMIDFSDVKEEDYILLLKEVKRINKLRWRK